MARVVSVSGDLTQENAEIVRAEALAALGDEGLALDLANVQFITTPGIGLLLELQRKVQQRGGKFSLRSVQPRVADVIRRTQLDRILLLDGGTPS